MKAILMSIQAKHLANILNGKKTLEIRKSIPKGFIGWVYLYCTKAKPYIDKITRLTVNVASFNGEQDLNGFVVARFWLDETHRINTLTYRSNYGKLELHPNSETEKLCKNACLSIQELLDYNKGKIFAWHIKNLELLDKPKELGEFYKRAVIVVRQRTPISSVTNKSEVLVELTKAPQNWMYVEVVE